MPRHVRTRSAIIGLLVVCLFLVGLPATATVSGQNGKIAFVSDRDGNPEIYVMEADGSNQVNLTNHPSSDRNPTWSPDGRQIAFVSDRDGERAIYVMDNDGSNLRFLVRGEYPAWSPDGKMIAFARSIAPNKNALFLLELDDDNHQTQITDPLRDPLPTGLIGRFDRSPIWSPDGTQIAFLRSHVTAGSPITHYDYLYVTAATPAGDPVRLPTSTTVRRYADPDWSPDGAKIVVGEIGHLNLTFQTVAVNVDGSGFAPLPAPAGSHPDVSWSPDGLRLTSGSDEIFVMRVDGSNAANLTNNPAADYQPAWQPLNPYPMGLVDPTAGMWHLRHEDGRVAGFFFGDPGDFPFLGDWDCDGIEAPGLYRQSDGFVYLRNSNTQGIADIRFFFGNPGDIPIAGDFDGDGCDTVSIYRPSEARIYVINQLGANDGGLGAAEHSYLFGDLGDKPFVGDFDGDGTDTVGLHRESTGMVYYRDSNTQGFAENTFVYGDPGDRLVAYDWNGDGRDSPAVFRPGNHTVYFRFFNSSDTADARYIWGAPGWLPVAGDFGPD